MCSSPIAIHDRVGNPLLQTWWLLWTWRKTNSCMYVARFRLAGLFSGTMLMRCGGEAAGRSKLFRLAPGRQSEAYHWKISHMVAYLRNVEEAIIGLTSHVAPLYQPIGSTAVAYVDGIEIG